MSTEHLQEDHALRHSVQTHVRTIYPKIDATMYSQQLIETMQLQGCKRQPTPHQNHWCEKDVWLITYGDSIQREGEPPLITLSEFLQKQLDNVINGVHILPFYPYSSDDGFSVIDYVQVNDSLGTWHDVERLAKRYRLMADLVINHCSARSRWFENFKKGIEPGKHYFIDVPNTIDTSLVTRPRTSDLLKETETLEGKKYVWCTFSHDQVDLNFANPEVLHEMVKIIKYYLDRGIRIFRLDAVAFLWKDAGSNCIHRPNTHNIIHLLRTLIEHRCPEAILITETNVPNHENLSYFGNANEAHAVYNFALPPLILQALLSGNSEKLKTWQMSMPPAQTGTFYFNFIASHDGIGLRPVEGLLSSEQIHELVTCMESFGGKISWRATEGGGRKPYEINIALYDALKGNLHGRDQWQLSRFLCAHAIMFALEGIPGIYIHSFVGTGNHYQGVEHTGQNRAINRYKWQIDELLEQLEDQSSEHSQVYQGIVTLLNIRIQQAAFHPNAVQFTLHLGDQIFGFWRQSPQRDQSIFCLHNVSDQVVTIALSAINLINLDTWIDLISGEKFEDLKSDLTLAPYQFMWLSNRSSEAID